MPLFIAPPFIFFFEGWKNLFVIIYDLFSNKFAVLVNSNDIYRVIKQIENMKATSNQIFDYIQGVNASSQTISSIGTFTSAFNVQVAESQVRELISILVNADKKETLAFKILDSTAKFSEKQIWVIAFELEKIEDYSNEVATYYVNQKAKASQKEQASKAKLQANKDASALNQVKEAGKKLGDYYVWLKKSSFKKEFFNKKYSVASVQEFINL